MTTGIAWTDETWNPVVGCTKVSAGCRFCYAKTLHDKRHKAALAGKSMPAQYLEPFETVQLMPARLAMPLHWTKPRRIFVNSVSDLFHPDVPDGFIVRVLMTMHEAYWHQFQVLTKRPGRMHDFFMRWDDLSGESRTPQLVRGPKAVRETHPSGRGQLFAAYLDSLASATGGEPPPGAAWPTFDWMEGPRWWGRFSLSNVWLGTSVEDQEAADNRIPELLETPAAVRFLSVEPLLGPVRLGPQWLEDLDWVIVGGESGPGARPCDLGWIRAIVAQCRAAGVPVFVKQLGARAVGDWGGKPQDWKPFFRGHWHLGDLKGGDPSEWAEDLRVREFPT